MKLASYKRRISKLGPRDLRRELAKIDKLSGKLDEQALSRQDGGGEYNEEERKKLKSLDARRKIVASAIQAKREARREKSREALVNGDPDPTGLSKPVVKRENVLDDPKKGFNSPKEFMTEVMLINQGVKEISPVMKHLQKKHSLQNAVGSDEHSTFSDPHGGFLLPSAFTPTILTVDYESEDFTSQIGMNNRLAGMTRRVPLNATKVPFNAVVDKNHQTSVAGGIIVSRRAEAASRDASRMKFEQVELTVNTLWGTAVATEELLTDSPTSFVALLANAFATAFAGQGINERLFGKGTGEPLGVLDDKNPALIKIDRDTANRLKGIDILKMMQKCWGYENAVWLANRDSLVDIEQLHIESDNNAGILKMTHDSLVDGQVVTFLKGRPLIYTEYMPALADAKCLALVNFSQYLEGIYQAPQSAESVHVRFDVHERMFKYWLRNDGRPWWKTVLTPKKGITMSPFVTLNDNS